MVRVKVGGKVESGVRITYIDWNARILLTFLKLVCYYNIKIVRNLTTWRWSGCCQSSYRMWRICHKKWYVRLPDDYVANTLTLTNLQMRSMMGWTLSCITSDQDWAENIINSSPIYLCWWHSWQVIYFLCVCYGCQRFMAFFLFLPVQSLTSFHVSSLITLSLDENTNILHPSHFVCNNFFLNGANKVKFMTVKKYWIGPVCMYSC